MAMRVPFLSMFMKSPFEGLQEHAEKVKECAWTFQQAMECHISDRCKRFEELREEIIKLESEADAIKRRIRGHMPKGTMMPVNIFLIFSYLKEQDSVLDAVEDALDWISYRSEPGITDALKNDFLKLVNAVINPIDELSVMVIEARSYFKNYSEKQRVIVKDIVRNLRKHEHEADQIEDIIKRKAFHMETDPVTVFHMIRLAEIIGSIADHAQNVGDVMRAMLSK